MGAVWILKISAATHTLRPFRTYGLKLTGHQAQLMCQYFINSSQLAPETEMYCFLFNFPLLASLQRPCTSHRLFLWISECFRFFFFFSSSQARHKIFVYVVISFQRVRSPTFVHTGQICGELSPALSVSNELQPFD